MIKLIFDLICDDEYPVGLVSLGLENKKAVSCEQADFSWSIPEFYKNSNSLIIQ